MPERRRIVILGAGGRDFHVFNTLYRDDPRTEVVAFTAAQIPNIADRTYPAALAGPHYPRGIPIRPEAEVESLVLSERVQEAVFAYSDVSHEQLDRLAHRLEQADCAFSTFDVERTMIRSRRPVVAVCAVRTGCGKSAVSRHVAAALREVGKRVAVLRHPMPYGNLGEQAVQRFATVEDLARHACTIEEMEEYEPHIRAGNLVFAGVDYARILAAAEEECDVVVWDGGNNDAPFVRPDLFIVLLDALRPGHELAYFPSRWNLEHADALLIAKSDEARPEDVETLRRHAARHNPKARVYLGRSPVHLSDAAAVRGRRVLVVEDGPTVTHGGMAYGAGFVAARRAEAAAIVDPRPYAQGQIAQALRQYPHVTAVLPALGYGQAEVADLEETIRRVPCDAVVVGTPIDLGRVLRIDRPVVRVTYGYEEGSSPGIADLVRERFA